MDSLTITNLSKTYNNGVKALDNISLSIPPGMFGLLGPNGAGKSTLMRILATLQQADQGEITLGKLDLFKHNNAVRKVLGFLPQEFGLYPRMTANVLLNHLAVLKGVINKTQRKERVSYLLQKVNLYEHKNKKLGGFSGGMKQRFGIAQALLANPKLLIVDEPTAGLDPVERNRFHNLLCELGNKTIVILSTHIVADVKELCPKMAILNKGKVLLQGNPKNLINDLEGKVFKKEIEKDDLPFYKKSHRVIAERLFLGKPIIHVYSERDPGNGFTPIEAQFEDVYFSQLFGS